MAFLRSHELVDFGEEGGVLAFGFFEILAVFLQGLFDFSDFLLGEEGGLVLGVFDLLGLLQVHEEASLGCLLGILFVMVFLLGRGVEVLMEGSEELLGVGLHTPHLANLE